MKTLQFLPGATLLLALCAPLTLPAANYNLYFDTGLATPADWFATNAWSSAAYPSPTYNQTWDINDPSNSNNTARFAFTSTSGGGEYIVNLIGTNVYLGNGGIVRTTSTPGYDNTRQLAFRNGTLNFNGGTINAGPSTSVAMGVQTGAKIVGNFSLTSGQLNFSTGIYQSGTMTVNGSNAFVSIDSAAAFSGSTHIVAQNGRVEMRAAGMTFGSVVIGALGDVQIGPPNTAGSVGVTFSSLSGGGTLRARVNAGGISTSHLTVNQAADTTYSGSVDGQSTPLSGNYTSLTFTKSGTGTLRLNGTAIELLVGTTVNDGTLLLNGGTTRDFGNNSGSTAITVNNGGTFGGTSNLAVLGGDNVLVNNGGILAAGDGVGAAGRTTFTCSGSTTGSLDLSGATSAADWLKYDLGADTTAGTDYDQIRVADGLLNIGTGLLNFSDFSFNTLSGFDVGTYTLFELTGTGALAGTLGSSLTGIVTTGYQGTLYLDGNDNILMDVTAVPEPSTVLLATAGLMVTLFAYRRRRRN